MRLCVYEDARVSLLDPLTLTRPAWDLWCGAATLLERQCRYFHATEVGFVVRPALASWYRFLHPSHPVNDMAWLGEGEENVLLVNGRWLPPAGSLDSVPTSPYFMRFDGTQIAFMFLPAKHCKELRPEALAAEMERFGRHYTSPPAGGALLNHPWDLIRHNAEALSRDRSCFPDSGNTDAIVLGPREQLFIAPGACLETPVVLDTRNGPVLIDRDAVVRAFSRLEGPCYIGPGTQVLGASVKASTIGPNCRVGGEVEASILQGHVNKHHDGFLGHSYIGEWVNLGAGTQVSDLRNDYDNVRLTLGPEAFDTGLVTRGLEVLPAEEQRRAGEAIDTGLMKVGAFLGDHVRTGVGTLLNCGTMAGAFAQLLPWGSYLPHLVPSFCTVWEGKIRERAGFRRLFTTAATAMSRRGQLWKAEHTEFFLTLYEATAEQRRAVLRQDTENRHKPTCLTGQTGAKHCC